MSNVIVNIDTKSVVDNLTALEQTQLPRVMRNTINKLANMSQEAERKGLIERLNLKRATWVLNGIYISKQGRATKADWSCTIEVEEHRAFLERMETGETHFPINGRKYLAIPNRAVLPGIVSRDNPLAVRNLNLRPDSAGQVKGDAGTFMIKTEKGGLILQRLADANYKNAGTTKRLKQMERMNKTRNAETGNRILYTLVSRSSVPVKLRFVETVTKTVNDNFQSVFNSQMELAIDSVVKTGM